MLLRPKASEALRKEIAHLDKVFLGPRSERRESGSSNGSSDCKIMGGKMMRGAGMILPCIILLSLSWGEDRSQRCLQ
jgi:hypothetical protein